MKLQPLKTPNFTKIEKFNHFSVCQNLSRPNKGYGSRGSWSLIRDLWLQI